MKLNEIVKNFYTGDYRELVNSYKEPINNLKEILEPNKVYTDIFNLAEDVVYMDDEHISQIDKLSILFELYDDIPSYTVLARILCINEISNDEKTPEKLFLWEKIYNYLSYSDEKHCKNIEYTLDVDYFEDPRFVYDIWDYFMSKELNETFLKRMLPITGSVPYKLKSSLYLKLLTEEKFHVYIFRGLYYSKFGSYGQINNVEAKKILEQLSLDLENDIYLKSDYNKLLLALL